MSGMVLKIFWFTSALCLVIAGPCRDRNCSSNDDCKTGVFSYCCGKCESSFCCGNASMEFNISRCTPEETEPEKWNSSIKMLGVIIAGMVASFVGAMAAHTLVRMCVKKMRKRSASEQTENGNVSDGGAQRHSFGEVRMNALPLYEDIDLYQRLEAMNSRTVRKSQEPPDVMGSDENDPPPPPYSEISIANADVDRTGLDKLTLSEEVARSNNASHVGINQGESTENSVNVTSLALVAQKLGIEDQPEEFWSTMVDLLKKLDASNEGSDLNGILERTECSRPEQATTSSSEQLPFKAHPTDS